MGYPPEYYLEKHQQHSILFDCGKRLGQIPWGEVSVRCFSNIMRYIKPRGVNTGGKL